MTPKGNADEWTPNRGGGRMIRLALGLVLLLVPVFVAVFCLFVWPTPYRYHTTSDHVWRENRITGQLYRTTWGEARKENVFKWQD